MTEASSPSSTRPESSPWIPDLLFAVVVGALCYALSCLIVAPAAEAVTFGAEWQKMSTAPFELLGQFPQRILGPLLANVLGMGGDLFVPFVRGLAVLLLTTVCFFARRRGAQHVDAALIALAVSVTAAIQMYKQHWVGFVDPLCYSLFFAMWLAERRPAVFWALYFCNLTNHELAAFLLPWAWFVRRRIDGNWRADAIGAGAALALYAAFYMWVKANAPAQAYSYEYFKDHPLFPGGTFVVVSLALAHWVVAFGPVLAVVAWHFHTRGGRGERFHLGWVLLGIAVIFCIAFDWARHANLIVLPFVLASIRFLASGQRTIYFALVLLGAGLMAWIPPWTASSWPIAVMADIKLWVETGVVVIVNGDYFPGTLESATQRWLPRVALLLGSVLAIGAAIWATGFALARWRKSAPGVAG
jgi:hypothetical protein